MHVCDFLMPRVSTFEETRSQQRPGIQASQSPSSWIEAKEVGGERGRRMGSLHSFTSVHTLFPCRSLLEDGQAWRILTSSRWFQPRDV